MKLFGYNFGFSKDLPVESEPKSVVYMGADEFTYGPEYPVINKRWDGEKNLGELGIVTRTVPDYHRLRIRMYSAYATIDSIKIIASKFFYWTIGSGLKLQVEPNRKVLASEGINNETSVYAEFQSLTEARFQIYASSKNSDYAKEKNLHDLGLEAYQGMFLGGDMLCIVRYESYGPTMQVVSGEHVCDPPLEEFEKAKGRGNKIKHGIEIDKKGGHVAYFVVNDNEDLTQSFDRILAFGEKTKRRMAWMVSGKKISPDHVRSVPQMSQSLEKVNKLDRYTEATVTKAEQGANIVHTIEHQDFSTGEGVFEKKLNQVKGISVVGQDIDSNKILADGLANRIVQQTGGMSYNMPNGAKLNSFESKAEPDYPAFKTAIFEEVSAGSDIPPEVAMQKYNSNYSASRAAINSFGYIVVINRNKFANDFYIPFYKLWLEFQILQDKINAPGFIENRDNFMVTESYAQCRFTGKNMPHIDPLKEVKAIREMLGIDGADPLISREQAVEMLNAGQWDENYLKYLEEENIIPKEKLVEVEQKTDKNVKK